MLLPASVADNVVTCHSVEHPCGASALRGLASFDISLVGEGGCLSTRWGGEGPLDVAAGERR